MARRDDPGRLGPLAAARPTDSDPRVTAAAAAVLIAVAVAQVADYLTFTRMIAIAGTGAELNPLVAHGAETLGLAFLAAAKATLIVLVAAVFAVVAPQRRALAAVVATVGTLAGIVGAYSNLLAIV
jgi:hypothetical protein